MDKRLLFILIAGAQFIVAFAQTRSYYFVNESLSWTSAQSVCRHNYTDLATIESTADVEAVLSTLSNYTGKAWIGLYDELHNSWKWSLNDSSFYGVGEYAFRNWFPGSPNDFFGPQLCVKIFTVSIDALGRWDDRQCSDVRIFVCYNGTINGTPSFVVSNISLNWTEAQKFCRENYVDLASIRNQTENDLISNLTSSPDMWIGLYRDKLWSDGSTSLFRHWADGQPSDETGVHCAAAEFGSGRWYDEICTQSFPFVCYKQSDVSTFKVLQNAKGFKSSAQDETSITLQWDKINSNTSFVLQFNGTETNISTPAGVGPVTHTVQNLSAGNKYTFTVLSVLENVRSSGVTVTAATAPQNPEDFRPSAQDETSITLQWDKINSNTSFVLQFNGTETNISAPDGVGPVTHTVTYLSAGTKYTFTLFSVFANIRSSGVTITAATGPNYLIEMEMQLESLKELSKSEINGILVEFFKKQGLQPQFTLKFHSNTTLRRENPV